MGTERVVPMEEHENRLTKKREQQGRKSASVHELSPQVYQSLVGTMAASIQLPTAATASRLNKD